MDGMEPPVQATNKEEAEDDFFNSWSKPSTPKGSAPGTPRISTPPIMGQRAPSAGSSAGSTRASTPATSPAIPATAAPAGTRTLTSSAAARPARLGAGTSRLNSASSVSSSTTTSGAPKKSKLGLGAQKTKPVDFAQAERKALEEAERIKQLGYDRQREEQEEKARKEAESLRKAQELRPAVTSTATISTTKTAVEASKSPAFPRLGFGAIPGAGAAATVAAASSSTRSSSAPVVDDAPTTAREKFGSQKAISSDMFFGRNSYDPNAVSEAQTRLQNFQGATSISSNQYFGREEEEELGGLAGGVGSDGLLGDGSLAGFESAARDTVAKFLANPDVQNVGESIRTGALKVGCLSPAFHEIILMSSI